MIYRDLGNFLNSRRSVLGTRPIALIFVEDDVEVESTINHHLGLGFRSVIVFAGKEIVVPLEHEPSVHRIDYDMTREGATEMAVNAMIGAAPGMWFHYCYNA